MAVRLLRPAILLAAALSLGSCQVIGFLFSSVFPATAALIKAQADLSGQIPAGSGEAFRVRVVESGGHGYVVVIGSPPGGSAAYFFDLDLNPKSTFTGSSFAGSGVMADASGKIAVGSLLLDPASLSSTQNTISLNSSYASGVDGFVGVSTTSTTYNVANIFVQQGSSTLSFFPYPASWGTGGTQTSAMLSAGVQLDAVFDDGSPTGLVYIVVSSSGGGNNPTSYFLTVSKANFIAAAIPAVGSPSRDNLENESFGFSQGYIFAYDTGSSSFVEIDPSTGSIVKSLLSSSNDSSRIRYAYRVNGGSFYGFDTRTRTLTKYTQWW